MEKENKSAKSLISKSFGLNCLSTEVAEKIAEELLFNLKNVVTQANAVQKQSGCSMLMSNHLDIAMKRQNFPPQYGFKCDQNKPFGLVSGGGCDFSYIKEDEVDLRNFVNEFKDLEKPLEMKIHSHWLAVEGVQPTIPENCSLPKEELKKEDIDPMEKMNEAVAENTLEDGGSQLTLSLEQQVYFREITKACIQDKSKRRQTVAFRSLSLDREVYVIVPNLCIFIKEGVQINISRGNIAVLTNLMEMAKALVQNKCINNLSKWLHYLLPPVITCIVCKQLYAPPGKNNHFDLRNLASLVLKGICKNYNTGRNNIQARITVLFCRKLASLTDVPLGTLYGVLKSLENLGQHVIEIIVLPKIKDIGERIKDPLENPNASSLDRMEANKVKELILSILMPVLDSKPDLVDYKVFGYLGSDIEYKMKQASESNRISTNGFAIQPHFTNNFDDNSNSCNGSGTSEDLESEYLNLQTTLRHPGSSVVLNDPLTLSLSSSDSDDLETQNSQKKSSDIFEDLDSEYSNLQTTLTYPDSSVVVDGTLMLSSSSSDSEDLETQYSQKKDLGLGII